MPRSGRTRSRVRVKLRFSAYPIQSTLGVLGRKWGLLVLMNIAMRRATRFNEIRRSAPGMSKRILAMRLRELDRHGFITRTAGPGKFGRWQLTSKGADLLPVLLTLIYFESKWGDHSGEEVGGREFDISITRPRTKSG